MRDGSSTQVGRKGRIFPVYALEGVSHETRSAICQQLDDALNTDWFSVKETPRAAGISRY